MHSLSGLLGKVVMFDGPDYVGKTTQIGLVDKTLQANGIKTHRANYNGGTPIGEALRKVMLSKYDRPSMTDLYINLAQQHAFAELVDKLRKDKYVVLVDRSPLSIVAYQAFAGGIAKTKAYQAVNEVIRLLKPDLMICYKATMPTLNARRKLHEHATDYFEEKPESYFRQVAKGYQDASERCKATTIDGGRTIEQVQTETIQAIYQLAKR